MFDLAPVHGTGIIAPSAIHQIPATSQSITATHNEFSMSAWCICSRMRAAVLFMGLMILGRFPATLDAQSPATVPQVERLGDHLFRIGSIRVDTANSELSVAGKVNGSVTTLEFVANTRGGFKAYESAIELDTNAVVF